MCELYHYSNRTADFTRRSKVCVCCIIILTGLPTLLGKIKCVNSIII